MTELSITEARRESQLFEVLVLLFQQPKMTQVEACSQVGIVPKTFQQWVKQNPEFVEDVRGLIMESEKLGLLDLQLAYLEGIQHIVFKLKNPGDLHKYAGVIVAELQKTYHAAPGIEEDAHAFLKHGPKTHAQKSRFASLDISATETGIRVDVTRHQDVIEAEFQEVPPPQLEDIPQVAEESDQ
jgi:hypothetical protein